MNLGMYRRENGRDILLYPRTEGKRKKLKKGEIDQKN